MYRLTYVNIILISILLIHLGCKTPILNKKEFENTLPKSFECGNDSLNSAKIRWRIFFNDPFLISLIDSALINNQELNIIKQEIEISKNEIRAKKAEYLPFLTINGRGGIDKVGRYTRNGAIEANNDIRPGKSFPEPLSDYSIGLNASWEVDIWKKLRNAKKSAVYKYLASTEGQNFMITHLISEVSNGYYDLLALDNQLEILKRNIDIQSNALTIVRLQKESTRVTELAVKRFEAQIFHSKSLLFNVQQSIVEAENKLNLLLGRYPQHIARNIDYFKNISLNLINPGSPLQLLNNRPDVRKAENELLAANLDIKTARARFYPTLGISAGMGLQSFSSSLLTKTPESMLYNIIGELMSPLLNRNAIKATYYNANAKQIQTVYNYQRIVLTAYIEIMNQLSNINNLNNSYDLKVKQVEALNESVTISNNLFKSARADYLEVLLTQRDALESTLELVETKKLQLNAMTNMYQALGGGWE